MDNPDGDDRRDPVNEQAEQDTSAQDLRKKRAAANQLRRDQIKCNKEAKLNAADDWHRHLMKSSSVSRLGEPALAEEYSAKALSDVHESHEVWAVRKVVFCNKCGYYKELKSEKLRVPCPGVPPHSNNAAQLSRQRKGLHPKCVTKWSDGFDASVATPPFKLRGRSTE